MSEPRAAVIRKTMTSSVPLSLEIEPIAHAIHAEHITPVSDDYGKGPSAVPWEGLDEPVREKDRNAVRAIPRLLAAAGYNIASLP